MVSAYVLVKLYFQLSVHLLLAHSTSWFSAAGFNHSLDNCDVSASGYRPAVPVLAALAASSAAVSRLTSYF